jgi:hypothetical protein
MPSSASAQRPAEPSGVRLAIVGSGSLARATGLALTGIDGLSRVPTRVLVLARNGAAAADLAHVTQLRAAAAGRALRCSAAALDPTDPAALAAALAGFDPAGVLVCASTQSPWEPADRPSAWTDLLRRGGLAVALPFQAQIAAAVAAAVRQACPAAFVVNACLPDAVNPLLALLGTPVLTGTGNIGMLATALQDALGLPDERRLHVVAHHYHLRAPADPADEARAWLDGEPVPGVGAHLAAQRGADRRGMNDLTGALTARLLADLATGATRDTHLPGVAGRPGGYPVRVAAGAITLRTPDEAGAIARNRAWSVREGISFETERVRFAPPVSAALAPVAPELAEGFAAADYPEVLAMLHTVRDRLRAAS